RDQSVLGRLPVLLLAVVFFLVLVLAVVLAFAVAGRDEAVVVDDVVVDDEVMVPGVSGASGVRGEFGAVIDDENEMQRVAGSHAALQQRPLYAAHPLFRIVTLRIEEHRRVIHDPLCEKIRPSIGLGRSGGSEPTWPATSFGLASLSHPPITLDG